MTAVLLIGADEQFLRHTAGVGHPERPERLLAVSRALDGLGLMDPACRLPSRRASIEELLLVHDGDYISELRQFCEIGGGQLDADTAVTAASWDAACLAAGSGLAAIEALDAGEGSAAFLAVRPPGHHAVPAHAMGFCLFNNVAVTAAALRARGERVLIIDWDAHHGNGTQDIFWEDPQVLYISMHQAPLYPGTGAIHEIGGGEGIGTTINLPFGRGTTGDAYLAAFDRIIEPTADRFMPDRVLVSAGFDAHANDPLTDMGLNASDFGEMMSRTLGLFDSSGRCVVFLEGGYDLDALEGSVISTALALMGDALHGPTSHGGPPSAFGVLEAARALHGL